MEARSVHLLPKTVCSTPPFFLLALVSVTPAPALSAICFSDDSADEDEVLRKAEKVIVQQRHRLEQLSSLLLRTENEKVAAHRATQQEIGRYAHSAVGKQPKCSLVTYCVRLYLTTWQCLDTLQHAHNHRQLVDIFSCSHTQVSFEPRYNSVCVFTRKSTQVCAVYVDIYIDTQRHVCAYTLCFFLGFLRVR